MILREIIIIIIKWWIIINWMKIQVVKNNNWWIKIKDCNNKLTKKLLKVFFLKN